MEAKDIVCGSNERIIKRYAYEKITAKKSKQSCDSEVILTNKRLIHRVVVEEKKQLQTQTEEVSLNLIDSIETSFLTVKARMSAIGVFLSLLLVVAGALMLYFSGGDIGETLGIIGIACLALAIIVFIICFFCRKKEASFSLSVNNIFRNLDLVEHMDVSSMMKVAVSKKQKRRSVVKSILLAWIGSLLMCAVIVGIVALLMSLGMLDIDSNETTKYFAIVLPLLYLVILAATFSKIRTTLSYGKRRKVKKANYIKVFNSAVAEELVNEISTLIENAKNEKEN